MRKSDERLDYERNTVRYWLRVYANDPMAAFEMLARAVLDLGYDVYHHNHDTKLEVEGDER